MALGGAMLAAVAVIALIAFWDANREASAALDDFGLEQVRVAEAAAGELEARLAILYRDALALGQGTRECSAPIESRYQAVRVQESAQGPSAATVRGSPGFAFAIPLPGNRTVELTASASQLLAGISRIERPNQLAVVVARTDGSLRTGADREVQCDALVRAIAEGRSTERLPGAVAARLGLPARTAMAGIQRIDAGPLGRWSVAVVASAERERDREDRARLRVVLAVAFASGLTLGFGGLALWLQRREFGLQRELATAEIARERDERLSQLGRAAAMVTFAGGVAHEISTPLGVIAGRAEQLRARAPGDGRTEKYLAAILEQTDRIKQVIRGFLDLARGGTPALQEARPADVVRGALALVEHRFAEAGVRLEAHIAGSTGALHCDARLLEHALVNLLLNACDASRAHSTVQVAVTAGATAVDFEVCDEGDGIPEALASVVIEPFFTTKPPGKGTGLGLAIASEIARIHRGSLRLYPRSPRGTRAALSIPREPTAGGSHG